MYENGKIIPLSVPSIHGNEWKYIKECLDTNWVSSAGGFVSRFEDDLAKYVGVENGVAMSSGTAALHIALLVAGIHEDDEVLVPALTFISPVNTISYVGAHPVFMDVDPEYWQLDPQKFIDFLEHECTWKRGELHNRNTGRRVSAVIPVDLLGHSADMFPIVENARKYGMKIIEDATESLGAKYKGRRIGSLADIACFSFNGNKIITTGGGGMLVTGSMEYAEKSRYLSQQAKDDPVEYYHKEIGYNYRLTNIQAAMGCAQLEQIDSYIAKKRRIAELYQKKFNLIPGIRVPVEAEWGMSTFWLYTILVDKKAFGIDSRCLLKSLHNKNVQTRPLWHPIYSLPPYHKFQSYKIEVADRLYRDALSLPSSSDLLESEQEYVIENIQSANALK